MTGTTIGMRVPVTIDVNGTEVSTLARLDRKTIKNIYDWVKDEFEEKEVKPLSNDTLAEIGQGIAAKLKAAEDAKKWILMIDGIENVVSSEDLATKGFKGRL